jgi:hypothetical protein
LVVLSRWRLCDLRRLQPAQVDLGNMAQRVSKKNAVPAGPTLPKRSERILGLAVNILGRCIVWSLAQRTVQHGVLPGAYPVIAWLIISRKLPRPSCRGGAILGRADDFFAVRAESSVCEIRRDLRVIFSPEESNQG